MPELTSRPYHLYYLGTVFLQLLATVTSGIAFALSSTPLFLAGTIFWAAWFVFLFLLSSPNFDHQLAKWSGWLKPILGTFAVMLTICVIGEFVLIGMLNSHQIKLDKMPTQISKILGELDNVLVYSDATALTHQAAENLLSGMNPYTHPNIVEATQTYGATSNRLTPLRVGRLADDFPQPDKADIEQIWQAALQNPDELPIEIESQVNYPAGSFLLPAPFIALGIKDIRLVYLIFIVPAMAYILYQSRRNLKALLLIAVFLSYDIWTGVIVGDTGALTFPFVLLGWALIFRKWWLSAIFIGIAITTKQTAWFLLPFYLILSFRTYGTRRFLKSSIIAGSIFIFSNLPFVIMDPVVWYRSVFAPLLEPMFPSGVGIITLVTTGITAEIPSTAFAVMEFAVWILGIVWYYFNCRRFPNAGLVLSIFPLFFAWRSFWLYFFYMGFVLFAARILTDTTDSMRLAVKSKQSA